MSTLTRREALRVLSDHWMTAEQLTVTDRNGEWVAGTSFNDEFGTGNVNRRRLMAWLGY